MQLKPVQDQVVVVMGASSGIGRAAALRFAAEGAKVVVSARSEPGLASLVAEIRAAGGVAVAVPADVAHLDQVEAVAARAVGEFGRLDTWVHLAAVLVVAPFEQTTPEEFDRVLAVNLTGQVNGARAALPHLRRAGGGALVHVTSMGARRGVPLQTAYIASKHGVKGFVETLRVELQRERAPIAVTNIMPATINTPLFDKARTKIGTKPVAPPPVYEPRVVVDAILHAAQHPTRDLVVGGSARALITSNLLAAPLVDRVMRSWGYDVHHTEDPKDASAPDNLFGPLPGHDTVEGTVGEHALPRSVYTVLARQRALAGSVLSRAVERVLPAGPPSSAAQRAGSRDGAASAAGKVPSA